MKFLLDTNTCIAYLARQERGRLRTHACARDRPRAMPTVHLICGSTGAGKTTYSLALADRVGAIRFSIDEWMVTLFMADWPPTPDLAWALERNARCEAQMWRVADQLLARGCDVIFDVGLSKREHRDRFRARAEQVGVPNRLHFLDVDPKTRRERVHRRNAEKSASYSFEVSDAMFDFMEGWFDGRAPRSWSARRSFKGLLESSEGRAHRAASRWLAAAR